MSEKTPTPMEEATRLDNALQAFRNANKNGNGKTFRGCLLAAIQAYNSDPISNQLAATVSPIYHAGLPDLNNQSRVVNPYRQEPVTFLPGDKVMDLRDAKKRVYRIVGRVAHFDSELLTLREVGNDSNEQSVIAKDVVPYLRMVAEVSASTSPTDPPLNALAELEEKATKGEWQANDLLPGVRRTNSGD